MQKTCIKTSMSMLKSYFFQVSQHAPFRRLDLFLSRDHILQDDAILWSFGTFSCLGKALIVLDWNDSRESASDFLIYTMLRDLEFCIKPSWRANAIFGDDFFVKLSFSSPFSSAKTMSWAQRPLLSSWEMRNGLSLSSSLIQEVSHLII